MLRVLPVLIAIALAVYCLVDVLQRRSDDVRYVPRWAWGAIILLVPIVGPIGYLVAGRPPKQGGDAAGTGELPRRAPDDDPDFLAELHRRRQREQEEKLRRWQEELEERERDLHRQRDDDEGKGPPAGSN